MLNANFSRRAPADGYRIGIVNPLTLVARELVELLESRSFPFARLALIDTTGEEGGKLTEAGGAVAIVAPATEEAFQDIDLVFFTGPAAKNLPWIELRDRIGFTAIDLSQSPGAESDGEVVVGGVNADRVAGQSSLFVSPSPFIVPVILLLDRLRRSHEIRHAAATVIRPASDFDQKGIDEMFRQTVEVLNLQAIPTEVFDRQTSFSNYPPWDAAALETRASSQLREVLGTGFPVSVQLTQGGLFHGHAVSLFVVLNDTPEEDELLRELTATEGVTAPDEDRRTTTVDAAGTDEVLIGRIARDEANPDSFWIWAAADNLRRGSALNAVLIAESLVTTFGPKPN